MRRVSNSQSCQGLMAILHTQGDVLRGSLREDERQDSKLTPSGEQIIGFEELMQESVITERRLCSREILRPRLVDNKGAEKELKNVKSYQEIYYKAMQRKP